MKTLPDPMPGLTLRGLLRRMAWALLPAAAIGAGMVRSAHAAAPDRWAQVLEMASPGLLLVGGAALGSAAWIAWLRREVRRRRDAEAAMAASRDEAEAAAAHRKRFISFLSHESRSLVAAMVGGLELAGRDIEPALRQRIIDGLRANASGLKQLLDESLDAAAIDAGAVRIEPRELRVACVMRQVRDEAATLATAKQLALEVDIAAAGPLRVRADPVRLAQALRNLVFNALKFTPQGKVHVSAGLRRGEAGTLVTIEVADSGPGLAPEQIESLFRPFAQLNDRDALAGSGLGLAISRELVQRMGGQLSVRSAPGQGSIFMIELPSLAGGPAAQPDNPPQWAVVA